MIKLIADLVVFLVEIFRGVRIYEVIRIELIYAMFVKMEGEGGGKWLNF